MHIRFVLTAALAASLTVPAGAEGPKAPAPQASQPVNRPAEVVLASAEIRAPGQPSDGQAATPAKRPRAARVTSCRCGGQTPQQQ